MANEGNRTVWDQLNDEGLGNIGKPYPTNPSWKNSPSPSGPPPAGVPQGVPGGVPQGVPGGVPQGVPGGVSQGVPGGVPQGVPGGVPQGVPGGVSQGVPGGVPQGVPGGVPQGVPGGVPQGVPGGVPQGVPGGVPQGVPGGVSQGDGSSPRPLRAFMPSAQSDVMSASRFAKANRANLERMAETAKNLASGEQGDNPASVVVNSGRPDDRFVPSPEAVMDSLVISTELPRAAVRRRVEGTSAAREADAKRSGKFPGAVDSGRKMELGRKLAVWLSVSCFLLAGGLLYYYFFSPYGPHSTTEAAINFSASLGRDALGGTPGVSTITPSPVEEGEAEASSATSATEPVAVSSAVEEDEDTAVESEAIKVHVGGAVKNPGLVSLPLEARIDDAIKAAGGFTAEANRESVNLAGFVEDGDQVIVATKNKPAETASQAAPAPASASRARAKTVQAGRGAEAGEAAAPSTTRSAASGHRRGKAKAAAKAGGAGAEADREVVFGKVNINTASEIELLQLRGIGPQLAQAIIEYRSSLPNQRFTSADQLGEVAGIGEAKLAQMLPQVEL